MSAFVFAHDTETAGMLRGVTARRGAARVMRLLTVRPLASSRETRPSMAISASVPYSSLPTYARLKLPTCDPQKAAQLGAHSSDEAHTRDSAAQVTEKAVLICATSQVDQARSGIAPIKYSFRASKDRRSQH